MKVISKRAIKEFIDKNPRSEESLLRWYLLVKDADWQDFAELKKDFPATDYVGNGLFIFNIGGNKFRLIARVFFKKRIVYIRFVGTHDEYNKVKLSDL